MASGKRSLFFAMSADSHQLHTHSYQDSLSSTCHRLLNVNSHPLSKSSSNLTCVGQSSLEERLNYKQELKKSYSSTICHTLENKSDARSVQSPGWSSSQPGRMGLASEVQIISDQSANDRSESRTKTTNHFLITEQPSASWEVGDAKICVKSSTAGNVSSACAAHQQSMCEMQESRTALQRSHSDLTCSCKQQTYVTHIETSATHSSLSSSSCRHGPPGARMSFPTQRFGSETNENTSHYQNLVTHLPVLPRDQQVPTNTFDSGTIPRNTTVYTDPGTFHAAVLGHHMPGNGFPNRTMFNQATGIIHGGLTYGNIPNSAYSPMVMAVHNNSAGPCSIRQDALKADATIPAYCHSLPIPSIQLVPRLVCSVSETGREPAAPGYFHSFSASDILTYPKLVSSVSESGLDAKRVLKCCNVPGEQLQHAQHCAHQERAPPETKAACVALSSQQGADMVVTTKDMWTMTSMNDLTRGLKPPLERRDAEVQTLPTMECKSVATSPAAAAEGHPHVFPEVNLEQDLEAPKTPVREVRWDDEGMTWEVYGASVDPEVLGVAIQKHLEFQIEQFQTEPAEVAEKSNEEPPPEKPAKKRPFRTVMHSLRYPSCCARSSTAVE
ncbi:PREDICTED: G protein-regulated inducer of neurite outgrowth 2 isoform X1 [Lepidothrix coronata]|uniref:G protein-regulated inducer of neurite outgrowth 2 isoform X1 n=2 Tax=Lepidothrix coronata TaxID=321398 RepID=A0A6J0GK99_9PASS|nr:PREDICTED: G protein-regulated inducer of neurite outgrowth 2 isoform X1 [Lepidothrix coronata]